jgi:hypothetical protein
MAKGPLQDPASAGHKLGQLVGDWFEEYFVHPLLQAVSERLRLFLDSRFQPRAARGEKIVWQDEDGHAVDYDFVMELDGTKDRLGIPVAFIESFWRRGARHSRDKARDDSGKLLPMRDVHPTARFLGMVAGGDFTGPARQFVQQRGIDLFYIPKGKIVEAFSAIGLQMDYPDRLPEPEKALLASTFSRMLTRKRKMQAAAKLRSLVGEPSITTYVDRVRAALGALPQEIRIISRRNSAAVVFERIEDATEFLLQPMFDFSKPTETYLYEITYSDGSEFERDVATLDELKQLHVAIDRLAKHVCSTGSPV